MLTHIPQTQISYQDPLTISQWAAVRHSLGAIESNNNDAAVGLQGEITRYQILPALYRSAGGRMDRIYNESMTWRCVQIIMRPRLQKAKEFMGTNPTPEVIYLLWNAPRAIQAIDYDIHKITSPKLVDRSSRFANLYSDFLNHR